MVLADSAGLDRGGQLRQLRGHGGPVNDRRGRIRAASLNRRVISFGVMRSRAHSAARTAVRPRPVGRVGDFPEKSIHQPAVGPVLGLQPLSDIDAKLVAHQIRRRIAQQVVGGVDRIESGDDPFPCLLGRKETTSKGMNKSANRVRECDYLWMNRQLWIPCV